MLSHKKGHHLLRRGRRNCELFVAGDSLGRVSAASVLDRALSALVTIVTNFHLAELMLYVILLSRTP